MNLLFVMDVYIFGGCEKMLKNMTDRLLMDGNNVELLLIYKSTSNTYLNMLNENIKVHYLWDIDEKPYWYSRLLYWLNVGVPRLVLTRKKFQNYDCVICFKDDYQTNILVSRMPYKKIAWVHNITEPYKGIKKVGIKFKIANFIYSLVDKRYLATFSRFNHVVFVSEHARQALKQQCLRDFHGTVIYNYVDYEKINKLAQEKITDYQFTEFTLCYVGRLSEEKGVREIVTAFCNLYNTNKKIKLLIIGEGYQKKEILDIIMRRNCQGGVVFLGTKENPYPYIKKSDIVLCASHKESFGLVVLEALLLGSCVVSTKCGGPEELIVHERNGYLVEDCNSFETILRELTNGTKVLIKGDSNNQEFQGLEKKYYSQLQEIFENL